MVEIGGGSSRDPGDHQLAGWPVSRDNASHHRDAGVHGPVHDDQQGSNQYDAK
jgi:hypothetical protein